MEISELREPAPDQTSQLLRLYQAEGWWDEAASTPEALRGFIAGSWAYLTAVENGRIVGTARAVSDGVSDAYIQDVVVASSARGKGVGSRLISELAARLEAAGIGWIGLVAEEGTQAFYEKLGFSVMSGVPMLRRKGGA